MCTVTNDGEVAGDEVLMVYHRVGAEIRKGIGGAHPVPFKDLVDFSRVGPVAPGESVVVAFTLDRDKAASLVTADGSRKVCLHVWVAMPITNPPHVAHV